MTLDGVLNMATVLVLAGAIAYVSCLGSTTFWE